MRTYPGCSSILALSLSLGATAMVAAACAPDGGGGGGEGDTDGGDGDGDGDGDDDGGYPVDPAVDWPTLDCDPIVPEYCGYPFPNNVFTEANAERETGRQLALTEAAMPRHKGGTVTDPTPYNTKDGFQIRPTILAHLPGARPTGMADPLHIGDSLADDHPTVVLDTVTGERVAHFAELDVNTDDDSDRSILIQPASTLEPNRRYIVAIRGVQNEAGNVIPPSPAFEALRNFDDIEDPRAPLYADIFTRLDEAGVPAADLQLAWDFTTASVDDINGRLLTMRDESFDALADQSPGYRIDSVDDDYSADIQKRVRGHIEVPLYLDKPGPGGVMMIDGEGRPIQNGTAEYPFTVLIPKSAYQDAAPPVLFGHGLFGSQSQVQSSDFQSFANTSNFVMVALDWIGMSDEDPIPLSLFISGGQLEQFATVPDRLAQSQLNFLLATRLALTGLADDPAFDDGNGGSVIDTSTAYYYGGSQGGIMGVVYMALALDVERGVLAVPGQPYQLLLERSELFDPFADLINPNYEDAFDKQFLLAMAQLLWDRSEPAGYSAHVRRDPLPGTEAHEVLMLASIGDHQVSTLGAHVMARSVGAVNIAPTNREVWGLEEVTAPFTGSALIEYDFGLPPEPIYNVPMREGDDPHGRLADVPEAFAASEAFFLTGVVEQTCDGKCDPN